MNGTAALMGSIIDANTLEPILRAIVVDTASQISNIGTSADSSGNYQILGIPPGTYVFSSSRVGYKRVQSSAIRLNPNQLIILDFRLVKQSSSNMQTTYSN